MNDFTKILNEQFEDRDVQKHEAMKQVRVDMCLIPEVLNWHIAVENAKAAHASVTDEQKVTAVRAIASSEQKVTAVRAIASSEQKVSGRTIMDIYAEKHMAAHASAKELEDASHG